MKKLFKDKTKNVLIFGGSGFLGTQLVKRLVDDGFTNISVFARDEGKIINLMQEYPNVELITGDISDKFEVYQAMKGKDCVFHLAAFKHVGLAEKYARECVKTNLIGSLNILDCSVELKPEFVITTSTDKAVQVNGVYGATKYLVEELFKQYEKVNTETQYRTVRYGNVLYSTGSVLCKWKELIIQKKKLIVTDRDATRFFWTVDEAISLLLECLQEANDSTPWCPDMKSMKVGDLLDAMIQKYGDESHEYVVEVIGLQVGENKHEKILKDGSYSDQVERFTIEEIIGLI